MKHRNAILDFMLGLFSLEFKQVSLRHFLKSDNSGTVADKIINNKIRYLKYTPVLTRRLAKGMNYLADVKCPDTMSGLELQTQLRIGNDPAAPNPEETMLFIEHVLLRPLSQKPAENSLWFYTSRVTVAFPGYSGRFVNGSFRTLVMQIIEKSAPAHLYFSYIWCTNEEWNNISSLYDQWVSSFSQNDIVHDRISVRLCGIILENGKKS
jgi:hypothetical protein